MKTNRKGEKRCPKCGFMKKLKPHKIGTSICDSCAGLDEASRRWNSYYDRPPTHLNYLPGR